MNLSGLSAPSNFSTESIGSKLAIRDSIGSFRYYDPLLSGQTSIALDSVGATTTLSIMSGQTM